MKTLFIGGGVGCRAVLEMYVKGRLGILDLEILGIVDIDPAAPAMRFAAERGWPTFGAIEQALALDGLELVIELTGRDQVLEQIYRHLPSGVRVMDHVMARVFWDLEKVTDRLRDELRQKTELEAQMALDRAQLQEILDTVPDVVVVLSQDRQVVRVNRRLEELVGRSRDDLCGRPGAEVFARCDALLDVPQQAEVFAELRERRASTMRIHESANGGEPAFYQVTASPVFAGDGELVRVVQTSREITEQVLAKRSIEESERRFRQIICAVHGIITIKDLDGRFRLVNPRGEIVFGMKREEMLGRTAAELFDADVARLMEQNDREALAAGARHTAEEVIRLGERERVLISERLPLVDFEGRLASLCCVSRDVTRQRLMRDELIQTERLAAVGKLAAGVAHELNNPLTGILTFAEDLLQQAAPDDPTRGDYELIVNETLRCRRIVRDLLDYSRQRAPERQLIPLNRVVERTLQMIERQASFHNVELAVELGSDLPAVEVDPNLIQQAILNLIINARDAMDEQGQMFLATRVAGDGRRVEVDVRDTGCGIPEEQLGQIFEPFYSTKGQRGNGLGLPAVYSVMEQHGGRVEVESRVGIGSTFRLVFNSAEGREQERVQ